MKGAAGPRALQITPEVAGLGVFGYFPPMLWDALISKWPRRGGQRRGGVAAREEETCGVGGAGSIALAAVGEEAVERVLWDLARRIFVYLEKRSWRDSRLGVDSAALVSSMANDHAPSRTDAQSA